MTEPGKPISIPVEVETVDTESGEVVGRTLSSAMLMPAPAGKCPECATAHDPDQPHNAQSLFYQYAFYAQNGGRWPTWVDAMAHCDPEVRKLWTGHLEALGVDVAGGKLVPASQEG